MAIATVRYQVQHDSTYDYSSMVSSGHHFSHLSPRNTEHQQVLVHELLCDPAPAETIFIRDYFGNDTRSILINSPHEQLVVSARSQVDVFTPEHPADLLLQSWESALTQENQAWENPEVSEMRLPSQHVECLSQSVDYSMRFFRAGRPWLEAMLELTQAIRQEFSYAPEATTIYTPVSEVFENRQGVCQDFAHLMLSCLRSLKLPARYVSGYILNEPPPGVEKLLGSDASHAWVESWLPGLGWIGLDWF